MSFKLVFILLVIVSYAKKMQTSAMKACFQIAECSFSSTKIRWFLLKLFIKNEPLFVKSKLGLIFCDFFNFPYFKQGLFLFIFILAGNKGELKSSFFLFQKGSSPYIIRRKKSSFSIQEKERLLLYQRKSPLNKNQEDSFFPPLLISFQPVKHSDFNTVCIIIGQSGSLTVIILAPGIGEEEAEILRFYYHFFHHSTWTGWSGNRCRADFPYYINEKSHILQHFCRRCSSSFE